MKNKKICKDCGMGNNINADECWVCGCEL